MCSILWLWLSLPVALDIYPLHTVFLALNLKVYFEFDNFSAEIYGLRPIIEIKLSSAGNSFNIKNLATTREFKMTNLSS